MKLYVDGNALLAAMAASKHEAVVRGRPGRSRHNVQLWLQRYAATSDCDVIVVFHHGIDRVVSPAERHGRVKVVNVVEEDEVRQEIAGPANRSAVDERTRVVTDDARLRSALEHGKAVALSAQEFLGKARALLRGSDDEWHGEPDSKFTGVPEEEVETWLKFFETEQ